MERREVVVHRDLHGRLVVVRQRDVRDLPDRQAADLDLVARHELIRGLHMQDVRLAAAGAEHEHGDRDDGDDQ